ncbi:uncharacterized protein LOC114576297, partial [Exaiptasia diaphana]|uniref:Fibrinogen C-terminal domain-containing protein n=1 Tax=Exaiptasia diaphana TaxID=2652724 RepID=A0A913YSI4_EXADI
CQLNSADRFQYPQDFQDKPGFSYNGVENNQCSPNPCSKHGVCLHGYGNQYHCECHHGWTGKNCSNIEIGKSALTPAKTCLDLKNKRPSFPSASYWIDPDEADPSNAFLAYCDMETDGGGWTLVWAYTFTLYNRFKSAANVVIPTPKNYVNAFGNISETAPKTPTDFNALDFLKWRQIGSEVFMKSNINNWIACLPDVGSFVLRVAGSMKCRMIKQIASICSVIPDKFSCRYNGCFMSTMNAHFYFYFETNPADNWPTHDPCSQNQPNQLKNVQNPHGNIYVR